MKSTLFYLARELILSPKQFDTRLALSDILAENPERPEATTYINKLRDEKYVVTPLFLLDVVFKFEESRRTRKEVSKCLRRTIKQTRRFTKLKKERLRHALNVNNLFYGSPNILKNMLILLD